MVKKDMARSAWTRILSKKQIFRDFAHGEEKGKISLLKITEISEPLRRSYEGREVVLADTGYYWLQLALNRAHEWFTVMFDDRGTLVQIYADVTDGNDALIDNPCFEDMYLDYVVYGSRVYELDRDELEGAFAAGSISKEQYDTAVAEGEKLRVFLSENTEEVKAFFSEQFEKLKKELEAEY